MEYICKTCHKDLKNPQPKLPCQAVVNGLQITPLPHELQHFNDLEQRFISLRIPFMKLISLPRGGQYGINGHVSVYLLQLQQYQTYCLKCQKKYN